MTRRTRYFLIGAVGFLVLGLSIGLVAYYNGGLQSLTGASGPDELKYVPDDAAVVAYADVHQIMNSEFRQRIKELEPSKQETGQQEFRDQTGIDIERDINSVLAFMSAGAGAPDSGLGAGKSGVVIANGRFDEHKIGNLVQSKGGTVTKYGRTTLMTFGEGPHKGDGALAFISGSIIAVGSTDAVKATVDRADGRGKSSRSADSAKLMELVREVAPKGNAWVVGRFDALSNQARLPEQLASRIPPISWFTAAGQIDGGLSGTLSVEATDAAAAENLKKVVDGLTGLAGLQLRGSNAPSQVQQLLNSFRIVQTDKTLTLTFSISSDLLNGLAALGAKKHQPK